VHTNARQYGRARQSPPQRAGAVAGVVGGFEIDGGEAGHKFAINIIFLLDAIDINLFEILYKNSRVFYAMRLWPELYFAMVFKKQGVVISMLENRSTRPYRLYTLDCPSCIAAGCVLALGAMALLGWRLENEFLYRVIPGLPAMVPNTALGLVLSGLRFGCCWAKSAINCGSTLANCWR